MRNTAALVCALVLCAVTYTADTGTVPTTAHATVGTTQTPWNRGKKYAEEAAQQMDTRVRDYGLFRLPVHDYTHKLKRTIYGIKLEGEMSFRSGFVMGLDRIALEPQVYEFDEAGNATYIKTAFKLVNLTIFHDLSGHLKGHGAILGTAKHTFGVCHVVVRVWKEPSHRLHYRLSTLSVPSAKEIDYVPDTNVTRALARVTRLSSSLYLRDVIETWNHGVFSVLLGEILEHLTFPV